MVRQQTIKKRCSRCKHSTHVDIFSIQNIFCSYWVEVMPQSSTCNQFKNFVKPNYDTI